MTTARFNYRVGATPEGDPVRAQGQSVIRLVKLFKEHMGPAKAAGSSFTADAKGTVDKAFFAQIFTTIVGTAEGRAELQSILDDTQQNVATLLRAERRVVLDARVANPSLGLFSSGFQLQAHASGVTNWDDPEHVAALYYREVETVAKQATGASHAFCNGHLIRKSGDAEGPLGKLFTAIAGPIRFVHNDFCSDYDESVRGAFLSEGEKGATESSSATFGIVEQMKEAGITAADLDNSRLIMINTWRNVSKHPLTRSPLGVCDATTVSTDDFCRSSVGAAGKLAGGGGGMGGDAVLDFYSSTFNPGHQWYWYPKMTADEVLLIKTYDSALSPFRPGLHSAFDDDGTPDDAPERQSCEARVLCLVPNAAKL